jgi:hypothetical protein
LDAIKADDLQRVQELMPGKLNDAVVEARSKGIYMKAKIDDVHFGV